jgi:predicted dehydrogenase/threonine dehydrogenase-like Zn-dependent dehydrogenase
MRQVILRGGKAVVEDVPAPMVEPGTVLVRVQYSCISIGTELSGLRTSGLPLWKRALKQPANVQKALSSAVAIGPGRTWSMIRGQLAAGNATGYSAAGVVIEVGPGVEDLRPGDLVACAGAQSAHHAELIRVSRNLVAPFPDSLTAEDACVVTLGAIAMQGVRRAEPTLGETFVVLGLGILGQLTAQLLRANGCRVIGTDLDRGRIAIAQGLGMELEIDPDEERAADQVARLTDGIGADGVIITAATPSDEVVSTAFKMCRKKGRVVLVGDVGLDLNRADFYEKELDFRISSSYGPGRYDRGYEERGLDYPVAYVRWTENRNMAEFLRLVASGRIQVRPLVSAVYPVTEASAAYDELQHGTHRPLMVLLSYPEPPSSGGPPVRRIARAGRRVGATDKVRLAVVGAGGFAKGMHLPNLRALDATFSLQAVVSRTGHNASATAAQFGAAYATTDYAEVLRDSEVDAVLIATRHDLHVQMVLEALDAGKHVLVEKPLAVSRDELKLIAGWFDAQGADGPIMLTGFNRRFSPHAVRIQELTAKRVGPMILNYRMNAGYLGPDHWTHGKEGGGRNIGEACHIYDLFTFLCDSPIRRVHALAAKPQTHYYRSSDNFVAVTEFEDGSLATLTYTALGAPEHAKEELELFFDGKVVSMSDYKSLTVKGLKAEKLTASLPDKGQKAELEAFGSAVLSGGDWPIPLWQQLQAMDIAFTVEEAIGGAG